MQAHSFWECLSNNKFLKRLCYEKNILKIFCAYTSSGLFYKHITIVNDDSNIVNKWLKSLTDNLRVVIYNCNMFIIQANGIGLVFWYTTYIFCKNLNH
jgi:hypothetical protein